MKDDPIDAAMDAAEEEMAAKATEGTPEDTAPEVEKEAPEPESKDQEEAAPDQPEENSAAPVDAPASVETEAPAVAAPEVGIEAPQFWEAKDKALFAKIPPEARAAIAKYEQQRNDWAYKVQAEADKGKQIERKAAEVFEPYKLKLQANGCRDPLDAAERLLAWNEIFEQDPLAGIKDLMQKNGLTPNDLVGSQQDWQPTDPRLEQALAAAEEAKRIAEEQRSQFERQQQQAVLAEVERFKQGKDAQGHTRKAFAEMYSPQITQAAEQIEKLHPGMSLTEVLSHAYDFVKSQAMQSLGVNSVAQPSQQPAGVDVKKAQAAASSIKGAPGTEAGIKKKKARTIDEAFNMAEEQLGLR